MSFVDDNRLLEGVDEDSVDVKVEPSYINDKVDDFLCSRIVGALFRVPRSEGKWNLIHTTGRVMLSMCERCSRSLRSW